MNDRAIKTPEQIEQELNAQNFAKDQAKTLGFTFGGAGVGYFLGRNLADTKFSEWFADNVLDSSKLMKNVDTIARQEGKLISAKTYTIWGSAWLGLIIGSTFAGYEHWKRVRRQQFGVDEINNDVANIMESRVQFEETLGKQSELIKKIIAEKEARMGEEHHHADAHKKHHSHQEKEHERADARENKTAEGLGA